MYLLIQMVNNRRIDHIDLTFYVFLIFFLNILKFDFYLRVY